MSAIEAGSGASAMDPSRLKCSFAAPAVIVSTSVIENGALPPALMEEENANGVLVPVRSAKVVAVPNGLLPVSM